MQLKTFSLFLGMLGFIVACSSSPSPTPPNVLPTPGGYPVSTPGLSSLPSGYPGIAATAAYRDFEIVPATLSIPVGSTLQFIIQSTSGSVHRPMSQTEPTIFQAPDQLGQGATYSHVFSQPGTVTLLCAYHPEMKATLTVTP